MVCKIIKEGEFSLSDIPDIAGYPERADNVLFSLQKSLNKLLADIPEYSYSTYSFYSADVKDWGSIGINNSGDAQLRLLVNDENIITITALVYSKVGKLYPVYVGNTDIIREMNSHDVFSSSEYKRFADHVDQIRGKISRASAAIATSMSTIAESTFHFLKKYKAWLIAKKRMNEALEIKKSIYKYDIFSRSLEEVIESRWALRNAPRQIWLEGEEVDDQWLQTHWHLNFFQAKLENGKITELEDKPIKLGYTSTFNELKTKITLFKEQIDRALNEGRDLLSAIQAEFSMYAVWIAIVAMAVSIGTGIIAMLTNWPQ